MNQPSLQRQQELVQNFGRKEDRIMQVNTGPADPATYHKQEREYQAPNSGNYLNRSRSPLTNAQMGRAQQYYQPPSQIADARDEQANTAHARKASGSRPWRRDRSRGRSETLRSNEGSAHNLSQSNQMSPKRNRQLQMIQEPDLAQQQPPSRQLRSSPARD